MLTCSMIRFLSLLLLGLCACVVFCSPWSVGEVVVVPYVVCAVGCGDCDACTVVCVACVCAVRV